MKGGEKDTLFPQRQNAWNGTLFDAFSGRGCVAGQVESDTPPPGKNPLFVVNRGTYAENSYAWLLLVLEYVRVRFAKAL